MKFGGDSTMARQKLLEAKQCYRGLTFTDRGEILLDVTSVRMGRIMLSQTGRRLNLLPEMIMEIDQARRDGRIPKSAEAPWHCPPPAHQDQSDPMECFLSEQGEIRVRAGDLPGSIAISPAQLDDIVRCIVKPWLKICSPELSDAENHARLDSGSLSSVAGSGAPSRAATPGLF
jgi:hypothetical protein